MLVNDQRIERHRNQCPGNDKALPLGRQQSERDTQCGQNEGKLADLCEAGRDRQRGIQRVAQGQHQPRRRERLAQNDDDHYCEHLQRLREQDAWIEEHAYRNKEEHRKRLLQGQRIIRRTVAEFGFAHDHAGKESTKRERHPEQLARRKSNAQRGGDDAQGEQLA